MRLGSIGLRFPLGAQVPNITFASPSSLLDFDVVVYDPATVIPEYAGDKPKTVDGVPYLPAAKNSQLIQDSARRKREFEELLSLGRTVVLFAPAPAKWVSDQPIPGRAAQLVQGNYRTLLPVPLDLVTSAGDQIAPLPGRAISAFWARCGSFFQYRAILANPPGEPQLVIAQTEKILSTFMPIQSGHLIVLPYPAQVELYRGDRPDELRKSLCALVHELKGPRGELELPSWTLNYQFESERAARVVLAELETRREELIARIAHHQERMAQLEQNKALFTGSGRPLELAVQRALESLGFEVKQGAAGRDDLIAQHGNRVAVLEVKGTSKSAGEHQAAQLEKWVSDYFLDHKVRAKGMLVVNAFRQLPLAERTEDPFPNQMLEYSERREHCLLTGVQLLGAVLTVQMEPDRRDEVVDSLFATNGVYPYFQDWREFLGGPTPAA